MFISSVVIQSSALTVDRTDMNSTSSIHLLTNPDTRKVTAIQRSLATVAELVTSLVVRGHWLTRDSCECTQRTVNDCSQLVSHSLCVSYVRAVAQKWGAHSVCFAVRWSLNRSAQDLVSSLSKCAAMSGAALNLHFYSFNDSTFFSVVYLSILICLFSVFAC